MTARVRPAEATRVAGRRLAAAGVPAAAHDARALAEHVLGTALVLAPAQLTGEAAECFAAEYERLVARRAAREPLQHLTGRMDFRYLTLPAGPGVFVVRPETEVLVDHALAALRELSADGAARVVDLCTGSGAIALALATERPRTAVWGVELSATAAARATANAATYASAAARIGSNATIVGGDATDLGAARPLAELDGGVDLVTANPPYIPPDAVPVDPEVRDHDPELALYGRGADGLDVPAGVLHRAARLLRPGGVVLMEHADVQGAGARELATSLGFLGAATLPDLTGRDRFLRAVWPGGPETADGPPDEPVDGPGDGRVDETGDAGDPVCLVPRLCPECGAVPEGDPTAPCWRCGHR